MQWGLFPLQRRPLQQRDGRGLMLVAAHVALGRQPWTTCRRRFTSEQCSSRPRTVRTRTHETRSQACWSRTLPIVMQPCKGADPSLTNPTCSLRAMPSCCNFCQPRAPHLTASLREQPAPASVPPLHHFMVLPTSSELCPRPYILLSSCRQVCWCCPLPVAP